MDYALTKFGRRGRIIQAHGNTPLTIEMLRDEVPSLFSEKAREDCSPTYTFLPTLPILESLQHEGFYPVEVRAGYSRDYDRMPFVKHLVRLRPREYADAGLLQEYPEVVVINAHDATAKLKVLAGWFRLVCRNGLIVSDHDFPSLEVFHRGESAPVVEAALRIAASFPQQVERIAEFRGKTLSYNQQWAFAREAGALRWQEGSVLTPDLLEARRNEDLGDDLWSVFNRVQEHVLRGGVEAGRATGGAGLRKARSVNAIGPTLSLNQQLWALATNYLNN